MSLNADVGFFPAFAGKATWRCKKKRGVRAAAGGFEPVSGGRGEEGFEPFETKRGEIGLTGFSLPDYSAEIPNFYSGSIHAF